MFHPHSVQINALRYDRAYHSDFAFCPDGDRAVQIKCFLPHMAAISELIRQNGGRLNSQTISFDDSASRDNFLAEAGRLNHYEVCNPERWLFAYQSSHCLRPEIENYIATVAGPDTDRCLRFSRRAARPAHVLHYARLGILNRLLGYVRTVEAGGLAIYPWPQIEASKINWLIPLLASKRIENLESRLRASRTADGWIVISTAAIGLALIQAANYNRVIYDVVQNLSEYSETRFAGIQNQTALSALVFELMES